MLASIGAGAVLLAVGVMAASPASASTDHSSVLARIKMCESGGSYTAVNASSGASGAYQFLDSTWRTVPASAGYASAAAAPASVQDRAAQQLFARDGTTPWLASASCWRHDAGAVMGSAAVPADMVATTSHPALASQPNQSNQQSADPGDGEDGSVRSNDVAQRGAGEHSDGYMLRQQQEEGR